MFVRAKKKAERLLAKHGLPYYRMAGKTRHLVVLVRPGELPPELEPDVIATRVSPLIVDGKPVEGFPERYRKGWPHCLTDEEAKALGVERPRPENARYMGGDEASALPPPRRSKTQ